MRIPHVKADSYTDDYDQEELIIVGRGRKVNTGTRHGYAGTLDCEFRDTADSTAREKKAKLELIKQLQTTCYLRTPFGDLYQIAVGNISISRVAGVGANEFVDVQIPYMEIM